MAGQTGSHHSQPGEPSAGPPASPPVSARQAVRSTSWVALLPPDGVPLYLWGFSARKRQIAARFLPQWPMLVPRAPSRVPPDAVLLLWGSAPVPAGLPDTVRVLRLEDGFLRSVGLGADLVQPLSWIVDGRGIYYDATRPSDLEHLLAHAEFDAALCARAQALRQAIVAQRITKYNVGAHVWQRPPGAKRVILVPGQVESDASIRQGTALVRSNLQLLKAVRDHHTDAYVVYKPHPDVLAGLRTAAADEAEARRCCSEVVLHADMAQLLDEVDEVQVMTSLAGFEALLRGKPVTTHGMPFYAGWGLTTDLGLSPEVAARRGRRLALDELAAACLILYPRYVGLASGRPASPEAVLAELQAWRADKGEALPWWRVAARPLLGLAARWRGG